MTTPLLELSTVTDRILARCQIATDLVGDGRKPPGAGWQGAEGESAFVPYIIVYGLPSLRHGPDASMADRNVAPVIHWQTTIVGADRRHAGQIADKLAEVLLAGPINLTGTGYTQVTLAHEQPIAPTRDEGLVTPLFYAVDRWRLDTCLAP